MIFSFVISLLLASFVGCVRYFAGTPIFVSAADGFFVSGVILLSVSLIRYAILGGVADSISYSLGRLLFLHSDRSYHDYKERVSRERAGRTRGSFSLVLAGSVFLFVGILLSFVAKG